MKMTLKKDLNIKSLVLRHNIMLEVSNLTMGREGVLQTEKDLYLVLAFMDNLVEEDLIEEINEDGRDLTAIMLEDIEPEFLKLLNKTEYKELYDEMRLLHLQRCKEIWDNQHSIIGVIDTVLEALTLLQDEDKKEVLIETGKMAAEVAKQRTKTMETKMDQSNAKLEEFVRTYREKVNNLNENDTK